MSRAADLPKLTHQLIDSFSPATETRRPKSKAQAGRLGGKARVARRQAVLGKLARLQFALANYVMTSVERRPRPAAQQVAMLARHTPALVHSLEQWGVPYVPSEDPRALVPFLIAGYFYAQLFDQLARPPHRVTEAWKDLREAAEQRLRRDGSETGARIVFSRPGPRSAWMANSQLAAEGLARLDDRVEDALVLIRRCANPACPTPFFALRGARAKSARTCGRSRCRVALFRATATPRRGVTTQQRQAKVPGLSPAPRPRRSPLKSAPGAR